LRDEEGNVINPVAGENADKPYSPKQTCGRCHDYDKITQGYHFMQGRGEEPTADQKARCLWASTPGNYGGTWCSPAPLYKYLSPKENESPAAMDMTSFLVASRLEMKQLVGSGLQPGDFHVREALPFGRVGVQV
jgi:hypothetical protein